VPGSIEEQPIESVIARSDSDTAISIKFRTMPTGMLRLRLEMTGAVSAVHSLNIGIPTDFPWLPHRKAFTTELASCVRPPISSV
jgi:hypothetical protein